MEASLTCAVCLSLFEEPVTLPLCSHNFCRGCLAECLSLARSASEEPSPPSSPQEASRARSYESWHQVSSARASGGGLATVSFSCPLCRKACPLPRDLGAAALPVNTTLAEVVKLFKASHREGAEEDEASSSDLIPQLASLGERCSKHPGRALLLYCRLCRRGGCSQCVSEDHRGIFHAVNLIDTVYQEEKLAFFSNLKKLRTVHLQLMNEISTCSDDSGALMQNEEAEFENTCNALQTRKKQLFEDLESQKKRKEKECQIWKRMKEVHRKTIEKILNDCENLVNECDPQRFLEVACNLNQRMKTQLDLMDMASHHENQFECKQMQINTSVVNDILALKLTAVDRDAIKDVTSGDSEHFVFANTEKKWENQKCAQDIFHPMTRGDTTLDNGSNIPSLSVLATAKSESLSYEEVRYNYLARRIYSDELKTQASAPNEKMTLPKSLPSSITSLEIPPSFLNAEANNQKELKITVSQKEVVKESNSVGFTFSAPAGNLNFSASNNIFNIQKSQKDSKKTSLPRKGILKPATIPPPRSTTLPFGTQPSFTGLSNLPQSAPSSAASINFNSLCVAQHPAPPLVFSSSDSLTSYTATTGSAPSFKANNPCFTFSLGKTESQDYTFNSINGCNASTVVSFSATTATTSTMSFPPAFPIVGPGLGSARENSCFSVLPTSSQNAPFQTAMPSSSQQVLFPIVQKTEENKATSFTKDHNLGAGWLTPPAVSKQSGGISYCSENVACSSASCDFEKADASKLQSVPGNLSPGNCWTNNAQCLFTFKGNLKNRCVGLTSSMGSFNKHVHEGNVDPPKSAVPLKNNVPVYKEIKNLTSSSSFFSMDKCQKSETESTVSPQQNVAHDLTANMALVSPNLPEESRFLLEDSAKTEDHIGFPSLTNRGVSDVDSDAEDPSQASNSSDSSCTSEYFSVGEDKVLPS